MKKISVIFGTRPEAIKLCPLIKELKSTHLFHVDVILSGQHREMLEGITESFGIIPDLNMNIMKEGQSLSDITKAVLAKASELFEKSHTNLLLVHGDTSTAFAAALAAFYQKIPVGHVEAGLRTHSINEPFPEEFNRRCIDMISSFHFAPTETAKNNLILEGTEKNSIFVTGNTGIDALRFTVKESFSHPLRSIAKEHPTLLLTAHRRENLGKPLLGIYSAVRKIAESYGELRIICPVHKNPAVSEIAYAKLGGIKNIILCPPLELSVFHNLMARCRIILTDSGGIQEEAASLGIPTLVLRNITERPEAIGSVLKTVGCDEEAIYSEFSALYTDPEKYKKAACQSDIYGDGRASERITGILKNLI